MEEENVREMQLWQSSANLVNAHVCTHCLYIVLSGAKSVFWLYLDSKIATEIFRNNSSSVCPYNLLDSIVEDEGNSIGVAPIHGEILDHCKQRCDENIDKGCKSFGYCPNEKQGTCYLRDKMLTGSEPTVFRSDGCFTVYKADCVDGITTDIYFSAGKVITEFYNLMMINN